jgi:ceramide glucosyltransferase
MRTALILALVVSTGCAGELSITYAMKRVGEVHHFSPLAILRVVGQALRQGWLWIGVGLLAISFYGFLTMLSWYPVSFVVPTTSLSYVLGAFGAKFLLGERLSPTRWAGVVLICLGVALAWVDHMPEIPQATVAHGLALQVLLRTGLRDAVFAGAVASLGFYVFGAWAAWRFFGAAKHAAERNGESATPARAFTPPVSILKPVRGLDRNAYENFASFCRQDYPEFEILFAATDEADPAVSVIRRLMRDFPECVENPKRTIRLLVGVERAGANDKVAKLCRMAREARHEFLVITDSDVRVAPGYLRGVMAPFADARVGAVTALYRAIDSTRDDVAAGGMGEGAMPFGALMDAVGSSASFAGQALVARQVEGLKFAMGSTIATTRERLAEIGGFEALLDLHSDDYELGRRIAARGHRVELAQDPVEMEFPSETLGAYLRHELRWLVGIRNIRPGGHFGLLMTQGLPWAAAAALVSRSGVVAAAWLAAYLGIRLASGYVVGVWGLCDPVLRRKLWLLPLHDFFAFFTWLASFAVNRIEWRGLTVTLVKGRMVPVLRTPAAADAVDATAVNPLK